VRSNHIHICIQFGRFCQPSALHKCWIFVRQIQRLQLPTKVKVPSQFFSHPRSTSSNHSSQRRLLCTRHRQAIGVLDLDPHLRICAPITCCNYHNGLAFYIPFSHDLLYSLCFPRFSPLPLLHLIATKKKESVTH
jgi:hypothetical protein